MGGVRERPAEPTRAALSLRSAASPRVRGPGGCRVYSSDAKVRILATGLATYPDASVVCGALQVDPADALAMVNPAMLVEVLSDGTERYDRGEKFEHYRRIESLRDYVMVSLGARPCWRCTAW
ncbi:MAG: Uma2 family endonuclease [Deltaproteobacteria bacterium]|nr:Uma2 family endonuclease [Deltaproteobacteria bacterium]